MSEALYQQIILDHNRSPKNFGRLEPCTHHAKGYNPLCGDQYEVFILLEKALEAGTNGGETIEEIRFSGEGCAISKASASLMTQQLKGMSSEKALKKIEATLDFIRNQNRSLEADVGKMKVFSNLHKYPMRIKCAVLAWHACEKALTEKEAVVSTETQEGSP